MSATALAAPAHRGARTGRLPGPALAAALIAIASVAISMWSAVDVVDRRPHLRPADRQIADITLWVTVPLLLASVAGIILVLRKRSVAVLQAVAVLNLVISLNVMLRSVEIMTIVNVAIPAAVAGLLGAHSVRRFFVR